MANSIRAVKIRIDSTKSTAQVTKAMYMVSQSKVKKAESTYKKYKDFMSRISDLVVSVVDSSKNYDETHPMLTKRDVKNVAYLLITSDRGLAGAYNTSVCKAFEEEIASLENKNYICAAIGKKGYSYLKQKNHPLIIEDLILVRDDVMFVDIEPLATKIIDLYLSKQIDELVIIYNHYVNSITLEIKKEVILPVTEIKGEAKATDFIYESGVMHTLDKILPMYVENMIYGIILDAKTSEHSARMNSMKSATDNANEVIDKLQIVYNRARQDVITNELIDIIGGANAIGGKS